MLEEIRPTLQLRTKKKKKLCCILEGKATLTNRQNWKTKAKLLKFSVMTQFIIAVNSLGETDKSVGQLDIGQANQ